MFQHAVYHHDNQHVSHPLTPPFSCTLAGKGRAAILHTEYTPGSDYAQASTLPGNPIQPLSLKENEKE
jgi:hypothetical protein